MTSDTSYWDEEDYRGVGLEGDEDWQKIKNSLCHIKLSMSDGSSWTQRCSKHEEMMSKGQ